MRPEYTTGETVGKAANDFRRRAAGLDLKENTHQGGLYPPWWVSCAHSLDPSEKNRLLLYTAPSAAGGVKIRAAICLSSM